MKRAILLSSVVALLAVAMSSTGCKRPPKGVTPIAAGAPTTVPGTTERRDARDATPGPTPGPGVPVPPDTTAQGRPEPVPVPVPVPPADGFAQPDMAVFENMLMDTNAFQGDTVYFDFDSSVVKKSEFDKANRVGDHLKEKPLTALLVDGHCDERGTEEYNRALGERRALSLREYLILYGIGPERIRTRSWGEDRPVSLDHNEEAWSKNRRGEFILLLPLPPKN
ncbi:MAG: hypothetical protein FJ387_14005 [Verrucomicrobia bacterium]|nr:hypothetical protein [Verrucomicrobiota bacterium]